MLQCSFLNHLQILTLCEDKIHYSKLNFNSVLTYMVVTTDEPVADNEINLLKIHNSI